MRQPLAVDLFCGLGGWSDGLIRVGYRCVGYDIEAHEYGDQKYPGQLVLADVLTLDGAQFADAALIVASPPCQEYSYMAMPWTLAKAKAAAIRADTTGEKLTQLNALFNACFRIQREACAAAGHHIPMVVENVRGAIPWVGRSRWNFGSFHLWGDVPALMPFSPRGPMKYGVTNRANGATNFHGHSGANDGSQKVPGFRFDGRGKSFQTAAAEQLGIKVPTEGPGRRTDVGNGARFTSREGAMDGTRIGGDWFSDPTSTCRRHGSKSNGRKMVSAMIAKIPEPLARHIGRTFYQKEAAE